MTGCCATASILLIHPNPKVETVPRRKLLTPAQVYELLNIDNEMLHVLIARGDLTAIKLGPRTTRVFEDSVEKLIAERRYE